MGFLSGLQKPGCSEAYLFLWHRRGKQPADHVVELLLDMLDQILQHLPLVRQDQRISYRTP